MAYRHSIGLGADEALEAAPSIEILTKLDERTLEIIRRQKEAERRDKIATIITIAGALFAAVRLGVVTIPKFLTKRASRVGELGSTAASSIVPNPVRRRRRARRRSRRS